MNTDIVAVVFTHKSVEQMLKHGGSQSWVLSRAACERIKYVVCTRNTDPPEDNDVGDRPEARNAAFLVGKVSGTRFVTNRNGRDRYLILFDEYALVDVPRFRSGTTRNPLTYSDVDQCRIRGLDIEALEWTPLPSIPPTHATEKAIATKAGLSIPEAKEGLSLYFGVPVDSIQITISG